MKNTISTSCFSIAMLFLSGCSLGYFVKQGTTQFKLNSQKIPIEKVLGDPDIPVEIKAKLRLAQEVREYSEKKLGLKKTKNYSYYLPIENKYLTFVVSAAQKYEMKEYLWKYPFIGALPYKGFFDIEDAKEEEKELEDQGLDVYLRGVSAFSTLGWFADPLTRPQLENYGKASLVEMIIHELTHSTVYFSGEGSFNESLAEFVAGIGTQDFLEYKYGKDSDVIRKWKTSLSDDELWGEFVRSSVEELRKFYENNKGVLNMDELKNREYESLKSRFKTGYLPRINNKKGYESLLKLKWNNAFLLSNLTYSSNPELFQKTYDMNNKDMPSFVEKIKSLKNRPKKESPFDALRSIVDIKK
jgi:predicted aminopeptidase